MSQFPSYIFLRAVTRSFLLSAVLVTFGTLLPVVSGASAQTAQSLPDQLTNLESQQGYTAPPGQSIVQRLQGLELKTFGSYGVGSIFERLAALQGRSQSSSSSSSPSTNLNQPQAPPLREPSKESKERISALLKSANLTKTVAVPNTFPPHFFRIERASANSDDENSNDKENDYFETVMQASKNRVFKFEKMPITIAIAAAADGGYTAAALAACGDWERRTDGMIKFTPLTRPEGARIKLTWAHLGNKTDSRDSTLGGHTVTKWTKKPSGRISLLSVGAIPVPLYIPSKGPKYTVPPQEIEINLDLIDTKDADIRYLTLRNIVAHEIGHALGLLGHSQEKGDLMFPITDEHSRISQRDLNTIRKLYDKKATVPL